MKSIVQLFISILLLSSSASAAVIYVDDSATGSNNGTSWANAYTDLNSALADAKANGTSNNEIWLAEGIYKPTSTSGNYSATFLIDNHSADLIIYGGFLGNESNVSERAGAVLNTILDGDILGDDTGAFGNQGDNSNNVIVVDKSNFLLDSVTVRGGNAAHSSISNRGTRGGGLFVFPGYANIRINNCVFEDNQSTLEGGAISISQTSVAMSFLIIRNNRSAQGGGIHYYNDEVSAATNATMHNMQFVENEATTSGGALSIELNGGSNRSLTLWEVQFQENLAGVSGGAVYAYDSIVKMFNALFKQNMASGTGSDGGGGLSVNSNSEVDLVVSGFQGNEADGLGGAIGVDAGSSLTVRSSTFRGNLANNTSSSVVGGGGLSLVSGTGIRHIINSIFWENVAGSTASTFEQQIKTHGSGNAPIYFYNDIEGSTGGVAGSSGNIDQDPVFAGPTMHLDHTSPAIDAGSLGTDASTGDFLPNDDIGVAGVDIDGDSATSEELYPYDLQGADRVEFLGLDMGAYEFRDADKDDRTDGKEIADSPSLDTNANIILDANELKLSFEIGGQVYPKTVQVAPSTLVPIKIENAAANSSLVLYFSTEKENVLFDSTCSVARKLKYPGPLSLGTVVTSGPMFAGRTVYANFTTPSSVPTSGIKIFVQVIESNPSPFSWYCKASNIPVLFVK